MANETRVSLTIEGADASGKKSSTKIPYINPTISNETMKDFAEKCAALSNDTYIGTTKTTEEDITNGGKTTPDVTWISPASGTIPVSAFVNLINGVYGWYSAEMRIEGATFTAGEKFYVKTEPTNFGNASMFGGFATVTKSNEATLYIMAAKGNSSNPQPHDGDKFTVLIPETDTSSATTIVLTVTADA